jgi:hypothetical protein
MIITIPAASKDAHPMRCKNLGSLRIITANMTDTGMEAWRTALTKAESACSWKAIRIK